MSYLHCSNKKCPWSQDDFWSESYNPFTYLHKAYAERLLTADLDVPWSPGLCKSEAEAIGRSGDLPWRELLAKQAEDAALVIRTMRWRTRDEWIAAGSPGCPECGSPLWED